MVANVLFDTPKNEVRNMAVRPPAEGVVTSKPPKRKVDFATPKLSANESWEVPLACGGSCLTFPLENGRN